MKVIYIQDQEVFRCDGYYYHPKSAYFFSKYLFGMKIDEILKVYTGVYDVGNKNEVEKYKLISHNQIQYIKLPNFRKISSILKIYHMLNKAVKEADFCYLRTGVTSGIAGGLCRRYRKPYMAVVNEDIYQNCIIHKKVSIKMVACVLGLLNKFMIKHADYAIYVTKFYLQNRYPCNGKTIGCSDTENIYISDDDLKKRINKINNQKGNIVLGTAAGINSDLKAQDVIINAMNILKERGNLHFEYQLVGPGDGAKLKDLVKKLGLQNNVFFIGEKKRDDVLAWMEDIDIYVHPSRSEGLPRTIIEAMSKGTPCLCSDVGGIPELIDEAFLFSHKDVDLYNTIANMLEKYTSDVMLQQAYVNFERAKMYQHNVLESERRQFIESAIKDVKERN